MRGHTALSLELNRPTKAQRCDAKHRRGNPQGETNPLAFKPRLIRLPASLQSAERAQVERNCKSQPQKQALPLVLPDRPERRRHFNGDFPRLSTASQNDQVGPSRRALQQTISISPVCLTHPRCSRPFALICSHHMPIRPPTRSAFRLSSFCSSSRPSSTRLSRGFDSASTSTSRA